MLYSGKWHTSPRQLGFNFYTLHTPIIPAVKPPAVILHITSCMDSRRCLIDTLLPYIEHSSLDAYNPVVLYRAEEAGQVSRIQILEPQQQHIISKAEQHTSVSYIDEEVLGWTPPRKPERCEQFQKQFRGPFRVSRPAVPDKL